MDLRDASAMTEASGMTSDPDADQTMSPSSTYSDEGSQEALLRTADLLRKMALAAPLSSLALAFMAGILFARRL